MPLHLVADNQSLDLGGPTACRDRPANPLSATTASEVDSVFEPAWAEWMSKNPPELFSGSCLTTTSSQAGMSTSSSSEFQSSHHELIGDVSFYPISPEVMTVDSYITTEDEPQSCPVDAFIIKRIYELTDTSQQNEHHQIVNNDDHNNNSNALNFQRELFQDGLTF